MAFLKSRNFDGVQSYCKMTNAAHFGHKASQGTIISFGFILTQKTRTVICEINDVLTSRICFFEVCRKYTMQVLHIIWLDRILVNYKNWEKMHCILDMNWSAVSFTWLCRKYAITFLPSFHQLRKTTILAAFWGQFPGRGKIALYILVPR